MGLDDKAKAFTEATEGKIQEAFGRANDNPELKEKGEDKQVEAAAKEGEKENAVRDVEKIPD
ncbi:MAG: CsbD family protein [Phormidesmis sp.]